MYMIEIVFEPLALLLEKYGYAALSIIMLIPFSVGFCYFGLISLDNKVLQHIDDINEDPLDKTKTMQSGFLQVVEKIIAIIIKIIKVGIITFAVVAAGIIFLLMWEFAAL